VTSAATCSAASLLRPARVRGTLLSVSKAQRRRIRGQAMGFALGLFL